MYIQATTPRPEPALRGRLAARIHHYFGRKGPAFLRHVWILAMPYWRADEKAYARRMLALLLAVKFATIWICVQQNNWYASFYAAIEHHDLSEFLRQIGIFGLIAGGFVTSVVYSHWVSESLKLRWRNWLVRRYTKDWLSNRTYYRLQLDGKPSANPDQRIVEDLDAVMGLPLAKWRSGVAVPQSDGVETGSERIGPKHHEGQPWSSMPESTSHWN